MAYCPPVDNIVLASNKVNKYYFVLDDFVNNIFYLYTYLTDEIKAFPFKYHGSGLNRYITLPAGTVAYKGNFGTWSLHLTYTEGTNLLVQSGSGYSYRILNVVDSSNNIVYRDLPSSTFYVALQPTGIQMNKNNTALVLNQTEVLTAALEPAGISKGIRWSSSDPSVATVNATGTVTVKKKGIAIITASVMYASGESVPPPPNVSADDVNNRIIGIDNTMEYKIDSNDYVAYDSTQVPDLSGNRTVLVRKRANGAIPTGEAKTLIFTANS